MEFGEKKDPENHTDPPIITHLTGLGIPEGSEVIVGFCEEKLTFNAQWEIQDESTDLMVPKIEKHTSSKEIMISDIQGIEIADESGRSLEKTALLGAIGLVALGPLGLLGGALLGGRKRHKSFLIFHVKQENKPSYSIVLGGKSQEESRSYYDYLIKMMYSE